MTDRIILFNAPPHAGKDTFADIIIDLYVIDKFSFAEPLKNACHSLFGFEGVGHKYFEGVKDEPQDYLGGLAWRKIYQDMSEKYTKVLYGEEHFGVAALNAIKQNRNDFGLYVFSDSGFLSEAMPLVREFGAENMLVVQLEREGCTFEGDTRDYIDVPGATTIRLENNGPKKGLPYRIKKEILSLII